MGPSKLIQFFRLAWPAALWLIYAYLGWRYRFGKAIAPGPGFFPVVIGGLGLIVSIIVLLGRGKESDFRNEAAEAGGGKVVFFAILMIVTVLLAPWVGQVVMLGVFTFFAGRLMGIRSRRTLVAMGLGTPGIVYLIFGYLLEAPLVEGVIFIRFK